MKMGGELI